MSTTKVTVHFTGSITYDAAALDCEGNHWPNTPEGHAEMMAADIESVMNTELMYGSESREPTDYVQEIHDVDVVGLASADVERLKELEKIVTSASELIGKFRADVDPITDSEGEPLLRKQSAYDHIRANYEGDAWELVRELARLAVK